MILSWTFAAGFGPLLGFVSLAYDFIFALLVSIGAFVPPV